MTWPMYSAACRKDVDQLLKQGGSLSAYRANKDCGAGPRKDSWAWRLERDIERRFNVKHAIVVNSGTAALHCALSGMHLNGSEVITSPYTFSATVSAILLAGGIPRFADVDPYTFCITKKTVNEAITRRTKAILPVSLFGCMCDAGEIRAHFGLPVVEDACQAVGAHKGNAFSGTGVDAGAYSFNGTKNIPAGEAGAAVANNDRIAEKMRLLANHGENFWQKEIGINYRPNEVTCAIAWHGLRELEERNQRRIDLANAVGENLYLTADAKTSTHNWMHIYGYGDKPKPRSILTVPGKVKNSHAFYAYPFLVSDNRHRFAQRMKRMGIAVGEGYITPHLGHYPAFKKYMTRPLPVVEELSTKTLCLLSTLTPDRPLSYADHVANCMRNALK